MKKFNITWTPGDDGGAAITGHDVGYTPSGGSETVVATGSTAAAYTLGGLTDDVEYSVRVRAENEAGKGAWSSAVVQTAALFAPSDITGLQAWYDASDASTVTESSGDISQIDDKSGNDYHLTQATAALKPTYETAVQNGLNVLTGIQDASTNRQTLESSNASLAAIGNGSFTVAVVVRMNTVGGSTGRGDLFLWQSAGNDNVTVRFNNTTDDFRIFFRDNSNNTEDAYSTDGLWSADQWYVMITTVDGNAITVYQDNSQVVTGDKTGLSISLTKYFMMRPLDSAGSMSIGEQVIYNAALSTEDRTLLYNHLVAKWGLA